MIGDDSQRRTGLAQTSKRLMPTGKPLKCSFVR